MSRMEEWEKNADRREESCLAAIYIFMSQKAAEELGRKQRNLHHFLLLSLPAK